MTNHDQWFPAEPEIEMPPEKRNVNDLLAEADAAIKALEESIEALRKEK